VRTVRTVFHANVASVISAVIGETAVSALHTSAGAIRRQQMTTAAWQVQGPAVQAAAVPLPAPAGVALVALAVGTDHVTARLLSHTNLVL
jgi:hypothetical protein